LDTCHKRGDIYEWIYEWKYCVGCEAFKKDDDLIYIDKETGLKVERPVSGKTKAVCPDHLVEPENIKEKNWFFKLSNYQTWIEEFYDANPDFVQPRFRYNEVKAFVKRGLEDFSISRETNTFGIPLPFDPSQVTYVWFDALFNYYTSCKYSRWWERNNENFIDESKEFWEENPNKVHIVGKDIIRFHAIFWPCMLASYFWLWEKDEKWIIHYKESDKIYLPTTILTWGFFTVDGQKMSKSLGNVIEPVEYASKYGKELLTLYMLSAFPFWLDGDYDRKDAILTYNAKLNDNLGNLVNRVVVLALKMWGILEHFSGDFWFTKENFFSTSEWKYEWNPIINKKSFQENTKRAFDNYNLKNILDNAFWYLKSLNDFTTKKEPWQMIKNPDLQEETREVLYTIAEWLRIVWLVLYPFFPEKMAEMFVRLWLLDYEERLENGELEKLLQETPTFEIKEKWENLFNRFEIL
jgi:methionyl-tRNA synthetase